MKKAALISVSDKTGLVEFAKVLSKLGYTILGTSGSKTFLKESGIEVESIEEYTQQKEILGGRVKTLHPKIHAGLLAKRSDPEHMKQLEADGILPIDIAVINLYPFSQNLAEHSGNPAKMVELIDIGGPTMIRAAAKNFTSVLPVIDPADYAEIALELSKAGSAEKLPLELRRKLALKVFSFISNYDLTISRYLSNVSFSDAQELSNGRVDSSNCFMLGDVTGAVLLKSQGLRYGENPNQSAAFYRASNHAEKTFEQLHGKELSYNNLLDFDAALKMARSFPSTDNAVVIVKHLNPCGAAYGKDVFDALRKAKLGDPRSHFGGVIAVNQALSTQAAQDIASEFAEIVIAPDFEPGALELLQKSKNLRILKCSMIPEYPYEFRSIQGGYLVQSADQGISNVKDGEVLTKKKPTDSEYDDLSFAWNLCSYVKSNAIVLAKDRMILGTGAGQMSRVDSAEIAVSKAKTHKHDLLGSVAASDAFFPFPDSVEFLAANGVRAIVAPSGAKRDADVVATCDSLGIALVFTADRHFRH